jgi:FkbM family methyltransferase
MDNPLRKPIGSMPPWIKSIIKTPATTKAYRKVDDLIAYYNDLIPYYSIQTCGPYYTRKIEEEYGTFHCPTTESWKMITRGMDTERPVISQMLEYTDVKEYDVFYDIGGNIGHFSCFIGKNVEKTVAFEPLEPNAELLKTNTQINNVDASIEIVAVSDKNGKSKLKIPITDEAGAEQATILETHPLNHNFISEREVNMVALDDYVTDKQLPEPDLVKIDIEGAGVNALKGMGTILSEIKPHIFIEPHENDKRIKTLLREYDYTINYVQPDRGENESPTIIAV